MNILGIHDGHNSGACILSNGVVVAAVNEERLSRVKNDVGYPSRAIAEVLRIAKLSGAGLDFVAVAAEERITPDWFLHTERWYLDKSLEAWANLELKFPALRTAVYPAINFARRHTVKKPELTKEALKRRLSKDLGVPEEKVVFVDHHTCHAAASYFGKPWAGRALVLTIDGRGDGICSTVSIGDGPTISRISSTPGGNSIAEWYIGATSYLGMKPMEHEYKVMGLAPYASRVHGEKVADALKKMMSFDSGLVFHSKIRSNISYYWMSKHFRNLRFDSIAYGIQKFTEDLVVGWVKAAVKKTGLKKIVLGGGLFMNVKLNKLIMELPEVEELFIFPSCGDESIPIGAAMHLYSMKVSAPKPIGAIYYGAQNSEEDIMGFIKKNSLQQKYRIEYHKDVNGAVAELVAKNQIVARCSGAMEFGARALGNRSILANPDNLDNLRTINLMIKSRDFWMPFAPSMLWEDQRRYIANPKGVRAPYMVLAFDSLEKERGSIRAAMHQYDFTVRPQLVEKGHNPDYHDIISLFRKETGTGAVLNTSFNLHGEPIAYSVEDAFHVFENSGLNCLQLNNYIVRKGNRKL